MDMTDRTAIAMNVFRGNVPPQFDNLPSITAIGLIAGALSGIWGSPGVLHGWVMSEFMSLSSPSEMMAFVVAPSVLSLTATMVLAAYLSRTAGPVRSRESFQAVLFALNMWFVGACASGICWLIYGLEEDRLSSPLFIVSGVAFLMIAIIVAKPARMAFKTLFPARNAG
ncbi:MAG TPA: hypothetical protein VEU51_08840 [Candidatus Acidoferrales bacterium]|nr:hypothetical protein [Candidatus Acidoferrales bacterium]